MTTLCAVSPQSYCEHALCAAGAIVMRYLSLLCSFLTVFLTACAAFTSELGGGGVVYFLPRSLLDVTITKTIKGPRVTYQIAVKPQVIPDPAHRYVLQYQPSPVSDDTLCVVRDKNGLLSQVQFSGDDRTPQIVFNLTRFLVGARGESPTGRASFAVNKQTKVVTETYVATIDPFNNDDLNAFNFAASAALNADIRVDVARMRKYLDDARETWPFLKKIEPHERCPQDHICYRTQLKLPLDLRLRGQRVDIAYADIVDEQNMGMISVTRAFLVEKISKLQFKQGVLEAAVIRKPSELEELSLLPINVVNAALSTPTGLVAAAFGNTADKVEIAKSIASLKTSVENLKASVISLEEGSAPVGSAASGLLNISCNNFVGAVVAGKPATK